MSSISTDSKPSWLSDPLDIITLMAALNTKKRRVQLSDDRWFKIRSATHKAKFDTTEPLFLVTPERDFNPMGFFTVKELQSRLDKM